MSHRCRSKSYAEIPLIGSDLKAKCDWEYYDFLNNFEWHALMHPRTRQIHAGTYADDGSVIWMEQMVVALSEDSIEIEVIS